MFKKKLFIATSSFAEGNKKLLKILKTNKINFKLNELKRKLTPQELIHYAKDCSHIIAGTEKYDQATLSKLKKLKFIFRLGKGLDNINLQFAKEIKIKVIKSNTSLEKAVGELTVGLILNLLRGISQHDNNLKKNIWKKEMGTILHGKKVGIIGYGKIGKYVSKILKAFGVKIIINDIKKIKNKLNLKKLLINSDIVSLHSNYSNKENYLLNRKNLKYLKKNSFIINTSRSELIDYNFLFHLLKENKIKGAALDVFPNEPYFGKFKKLNNVILTPHIGSYAIEIRDKMEDEAIKSILEF